MSQTTISIAALVLVTLFGVTGLRHFSYKVRLAFDGVCFACISSYFVLRGIFPVFPPLDDHANPDAIFFRVIGGAWWIFAAPLTVAALGFALHRDQRSREARLFSDLTAAGVYIATGLIVLNSVFALPITGVVATSGVVAIVLGLALQNTLADVFAGIAVGIEAPFRVGDRIQINDKLEGLVVEANWRSIRIQTDGDDVAIIPNSIVAKSEIVNRSFPIQRRAASVELSCPENVLPERVIETLLHSTLLCPDILPAPVPTAHLVRLGSIRNIYRIAFHVGNTDELETTKDLLLRAARRHLHYTGLLDRNRGQDQVKLDSGDNSFIPRRLLRDIIVFDCLTDDQVIELVRHLVSLRLEPGEIVFNQDQIDKSLYVIASGVIEISRALPGGTQSVGCIGVGDYIGEIGLLTGAAHAATAKARTHCEVLQLSHDALGPLLEQNAELLAAFDKSARKGLELLNREVAARAAPNIGDPGQLLARIRGFLGFGARDGKP